MKNMDKGAWLTIGGFVAMGIGFAASIASAIIGGKSETMKIEKAVDERICKLLSGEKK